MAKKSSGQYPRTAMDAVIHKGAKRANNPPAEHEHLVSNAPVRVRRYKVKLTDEPRLYWHGRNPDDEMTLDSEAPPIYQQERIHPQAMIGALRRTEERRQMSMKFFKDFNGLPNGADPMNFYAHTQNWTNRLIHGDSLKVMSSLCELENLRAQVQMIYFDPPYGINFRSNWQNKVGVLEGDEFGGALQPETIQAFRDTWKHGIHSYLSYIKDRLVLMHELLKDSGSVFLQISGENMQTIGQILNEVFGAENRAATIIYTTGGVRSSRMLSEGGTYILWYVKDKEAAEEKYHQLFETLDRKGIRELFSWHAMVEEPNGCCRPLTAEEGVNPEKIPAGCRMFQRRRLDSQGVSSTGRSKPFKCQGYEVACPDESHWSVSHDALARIVKAGRMATAPSGTRISRKLYEDEIPGKTISNIWSDKQRNPKDKFYVVQTSDDVIARCMLMTTDPGDLVFDPTCGSGTTAAVAERYGRRWIVADTSRVAISVARERMFGTLYDSYALCDSKEGAELERDRFGNDAFIKEEYGSDVSRGLVCDRIQTVSAKGIGENAEIDAIWDEFEQKMRPLREAMPKNDQGETMGDWQVPLDCPPDWTKAQAKSHKQWLALRMERKKAMDLSILKNSSDTTYLVNKPIALKGRIRVTGPFTVESLAPHSRCASVEELESAGAAMHGKQTAQMRQAEQSHENYRKTVRENLLKAGIKSGIKSVELRFTELEDAPAECNHIHLLGKYEEGGKEKTAAIMVGREYDAVTSSAVSRALKEAPRYAEDRLIVAGTAFDAHVAGEDRKLAGMNVQLVTIASDLMTNVSTSDSSYLFVPIGEPDIDCIRQTDGNYVIRVNGVSIINPKTLEVQATTTKQIACWMIDTDYDEDRFYACQIYFPNSTSNRDTMLSNIQRDIKDVDAEAIAALKSTQSQPFPPPQNNACIAVKVINHFGEEVIKIFRPEKMAG